MQLVWVRLDLQNWCSTYQGAVLDLGPGGLPEMSTKQFGTVSLSVGIFIRNTLIMAMEVLEPVELELNGAASVQETPFAQILESVGIPREN